MHIIQQHRQREQHAEHATPALTQLELQRYIRLARTFKPRIGPEAQQRLVKCYKKLREDRTFVRGAAGVTVRQLESLIRLSETIARVHLSDKVTVDFVTQAFELQLGTFRRAERENIDLEEPDAAAPAVPEAAGDEAAAAPAALVPAKPKRAKITYQEYQRIGHMLTKHLADKEDAGEEVKEEDLIAWYMEQVEEDIETEAQLVEQQHLVQLIINRMIDKDRVILVYAVSDDVLRPEGRVLVKHPNYPVGERISS
jgi:DNA replication licensing factor MCM6